MHQRLQSLLLAFLHSVEPIPLHSPPTLETVVPSLERDGVVDMKLRGIPEHLWDSCRGEVTRERIRDVCEQEGNVVGQGFWEDSRQSGEYIARARSHAWDGPISDDENNIDGVDMLLNFSDDILLVELVLLNTAGVSQPRRVEDANLGKELDIRTTFKHTGTYHHAVLARNLVKAGRVGSALVFASVRMVKDFEVVMINVIASEDIGDVFQE